MAYIGDEPVQQMLYQYPPLHLTGRRMRAFARLVSCAGGEIRMSGDYVSWSIGTVWKDPPRGVTYQQALDYLAECPDLPVSKVLRSLPFRTDNRLEDNLETLNRGANPSAVTALQDLSDDFFVDIFDACQTLSDPNVVYVGVDEGIDPVPDTHVELVIAAIQRELGRELRSHPQTGERLPAVNLSTLEWPVQRALIERRRLRFLQFGLGRQQWLTNRWSLWDIPEDREWSPRLPLKTSGLWEGVDANWATVHG